MITAQIDALKQLYLVSKDYTYYSNKTSIIMAKFKLIVDKIKGSKNVSISLDNYHWVDEEFCNPDLHFFSSYSIRMEYSMSRYARIKFTLSTYFTYGSDIYLYVISEYYWGYERLIRFFKKLVDDFLYTIEKYTIERWH